MTEIVERVAKAMLADLQLRPAQGGEHGCLIGSVAPDRHITVSGHIDLDHLARAAIVAVANEPTPEMIEAGALKITVARRNHWNHELQAKAVLQAMIDECLK